MNTSWRIAKWDLRYDQITRAYYSTTFEQPLKLARYYEHNLSSHPKKTTTYGGTYKQGEFISLY